MTYSPTLSRQRSEAATGLTAQTRLGDDSLVDVDRAFCEIAGGQRPIEGTEMVSLAQLRGRILAADVVSPIDLPPFDNSAMDGFALLASAAGREPPFHLRLRREIRAGHAMPGALDREETVRILTGAPIPTGVEAVVIEEGCALYGDGTVEVRRQTASGANIRRRGEDVTAGTTILQKGTAVDARHIALLAAAGLTSLQVVRRVRVGILSTGDELCSSDEELQPSGIHDANGPMLRALLKDSREEAVDLGRQTDNAHGLAIAFADAARRVDIIISSGGVSGSSADLVAGSVDAAGGRSKLYRLALKPGKPIMAGAIGSVPILGLPGNPGSALINFYLFGRPMLDSLQGLVPRRPNGRSAFAHSAVAHRPGRTEFMPARIISGSGSGAFEVQNIVPAGPARLSAITAADGFIEIPATLGDIAAGSEVLFHDATDVVGTLC